MKIRTIAAAVLIILLFSVNVFAEDASAVITAYDSEGKTIEKLTSGIIKFEAALQNVTTDASFIVIVYQNDEIIDFSVAQKSLPHGEQIKLYAEVNVPEETDGCETVAMLWDGLDEMNASCDEFVLD